MKPAHRLEIRRILAEHARPLRNEILRPGMPPKTCIYPGDDEGNTFHAGAFLSGGLVGIASIFEEPAPFDEHLVNAWRLRGMAVSEKVRRCGCGKALVKACLTHARENHGSILWCNARTSALPFYETIGFQKQGAEFNSPVSGPHYVVWRHISP